MDKFITANDTKKMAKFGSQIFSTVAMFTIKFVLVLLLFSTVLNYLIRFKIFIEQAYVLFLSKFQMEHNTTKEQINVS